MVSPVGLKESESISPELNWKKVTKGRRSRKPIGRSSNWGGKLKNQSPRRVGDFSGSDSDKLVEILNEQSAPDKAEGIPIKKRRHLLDTPIQSEEHDPISDDNHPPGNLSSSSYSDHQAVALKFCNSITDGILDVKCTKLQTGRSYYNTEDFSGIALLAAAACSNGVDDDIGTEKESRNQLGKDTIPENECSDFLQKNSAILQGLDEDNNKLGEFIPSVSPKVDRLYWDLNIPIDSWGKPQDDQATTGNAQNNGEIGHNKNHRVSNFTEGRIIPETSDLDNLKKIVEPFATSNEDISSPGDNLSNKSVHASTTLISQGQPTVAVFYSNSDEANISHHLSNCEALSSSVNDTHIGRSVKTESFFGDSHKSDISHEYRGQNNCGLHTKAFRAGYDSPFEDGELRGSGLCCWEENAVYGEDGCIDYDSTGNGMHDQHESEVVEDGSEDGSQGCSEKRLSSLNGRFVEADFSRGPRSLKNMRVQTRRYDSSMGGNYVRKGEVFGYRRSYNEDFGLRPDRAKLQSRTEGPMYVDAKDRKDSILFHPRRRPHSLGSYSRRPEREFSPERGFTPEKFMGSRSAFRERNMNPGGGHWEGSWDSRNRYPSTTYQHIPDGHRRRTFAANVTERFDRMGSHDQGNYSSNYIERRPHGFKRRISIEGGDDWYDSPRRMEPARIGHSGSYYSRGGRGGFVGHRGYFPLPDDDDGSPNGMRRCYLRKSRSRSRSSTPRSGRGFRGQGGDFSLPDDVDLSPIGARRRYFRKSRSRSKSSSSPRGWHYSPRDWNPQGMRGCPSGRLPDRRLRGVPNYVEADEYGREGFVSPPRRHFSPERRSRRTDVSQHFVGSRGRTPVRETIKRNQRFDALGPSNRFKSSNDHFRRTRRFPLMGGNEDSDMGRATMNSYDDISPRKKHSEDVAAVKETGHGGVDDKYEAGGNEEGKDEDIRCTGNAAQGTLVIDEDKK
ncbi:hypothetical protein DM860_010931 [Cuscuta australis]|uniref:Uncharacterized protein n=1 Tax=Cuscuta australis TaxID=267555 RepID=A0A328E498_9ASTE|nr:hypothetical protein DM860_010931 [Cuscuta australis]